MSQKICKNDYCPGLVDMGEGKYCSEECRQNHANDIAYDEEINHPYWDKTTKIVMVPVKITYHEPTGIIFDFTPPTLEDCSEALKKV